MAGSSPVKIETPRVLTGLAGAALVLALAWKPEWHGGFALLALLVLLLALAEFYDLARRLGFEPEKTLGLVLGGLLLYPSLGIAQIGLPQLGAAGGLFTLYVLSSSVLKGESFLGFSRLASTFLGLAYVAGLGQSLGYFLMRIPHKAWPFSEAAPSQSLVPLLVLTWVCDSVAMLVGSKWGRTKLSPASPNKSWEGVAGGTLAIVVLALLMPTLGFWADMSWWIRIGAALLVAPAAVLGDLVESSLKREAGAKDSATISFLPGHGGFLDKVDALLFTAPVLAIYLTWVR